MKNRWRRSGVLLVFLLGACGGPDSGEPSDGATSTVAETRVDAATDEPEIGTPSSAQQVATDRTGDERAIRAPSATSDANTTSTESIDVATAPSDPTAEGILGRAEQAYDGVRSMEADFVQNLTVALLGSSERSRGKIFHRRPDRFRMQFSEPAGDIVLADGDYLWMYYPSSDAKQVIRTALTDGAVEQVDFQRQFLSDAVERFNAQLVGDEAVNGRGAHVLLLVPTGESPFRRVKLWVDKNDSLVRRFKITEQNGTVREITLSNLRPNVTLADDLFEFTPPPGTQVFTQ